MAQYNSDAPVLDTYQAVVSAYSDFLTVAIHTILYEREIYPQASFIRARKYDFPVRQNRHPKVCKWIQDAVAAVEAEMLKCTVSTTSLILYAPPPTSKPLERYVFSTAAFPRILPSETLTPFSPAPPNPPAPKTTESTRSSSPTSNAQTAATTAAAAAKLPRFVPPPTSNLPEQFRATLSRLTTSLTRLSPLPEDCSFTLAIELRDEPDVEAPIGREEEKRWIVAEPGWQRIPENGPIGEAGNGEKGDEGRKGQTGKYLGGVKTTPVRSLEAGAFKMEVWVEEGKGKFQAMVEDGGDQDDTDGQKMDGEGEDFL